MQYMNQSEAGFYLQGPGRTGSTGWSARLQRIATTGMGKRTQGMRKHEESYVENSTGQPGSTQLELNEEGASNRLLALFEPMRSKEACKDAGDARSSKLR